MSSDVSIIREMKKLLKQSEIATFLVFATIAGIIDSFIIYYMFWHLEDVAAAGPHASSIKLIEGCVVAAECLGGEILFFSISGKIIKKIGYIHCLSLCFLNYAVRLYLISVITNPWYLIPIELVMQGASYSLAYTCIVVYASQIAPPGTSATVQGLVAGMDDGLGFAIGSLIGGQLFKSIGGKMSFRVFATGAFVTCFAHILFRPHKVPTSGRADPAAIQSVPNYGAREEIQYEFPVDKKMAQAV